MRVMVTGGNGFLGRWVVRELAASGHETYVPRSHEYDLRMIGYIEAALRDAEPDAIVHCAAAVGGIGANVAEPGRFYHDNALMGVQLIERARLHRVKKVVVIGTACEYPEHCPQPMREESVWDGRPAPATAPYAIAKRGLLAMGQAYREQYGMDVIHVIPSNLYGAGDHYDGDGVHVIPAMIRRFSDAVRSGSDEPVEMWGSGEATRDFLHVSDAAWGIAAALEFYSDPMPLNLGSGAETAICDLAHIIGHLYGHDNVIRWNREMADGTPRRLLDIRRAYRELGWRPLTHIGEGLRVTVEAYEESRR